MNQDPISNITTEFVKKTNLIASVCVMFGTAWRLAHSTYILVDASPRTKFIRPVVVDSFSLSAFQRIIREMGSCVTLMLFCCVLVIVGIGVKKVVAGGQKGKRSHSKHQKVCRGFLYITYKEIV